MTRSEAKAEAVRLVDSTEDWQVAIWNRFALHMINGVPIPKAEALFWRELAIAEARRRVK